MKRHIISATAVIIAILLSGCAVFSNTNTNNTKIDLGNSETYTDTELQAAADMIIAQIKSWNSVDEIRTVSYSGDIISAENLEYCNTLNNGVYDQCVVFESAFFTSGSADSAGFEPNSLYDGWMWYLARTDGGAWEVVTCGYA